MKMNDQTEEKGEDVVNMVQVLEDEESLQEDANAVLGASDAVQCTYTKGYIPRQALYACRTCRLMDNELAGICLACALECHEGHDLVELYTKRHFCCDCGNSKFMEGKNICKLCPDKSPTNAENRYNQNFKGVYCQCARPYPDPEDSVDDIMLQCSICEDWFHGRHLGLENDLPEQDSFEEMTCELCTNRCSFLRMYANCFSSGQSAGCLESDEVVDIEGGVPAKSNSSDHGGSDAAAGLALAVAKAPECRLKEMSRQSVGQSPAAGGAAFWRSGWRKKLCRCSDCLSLYDGHGVSFLTDESDTIAAYEERGKQMSNKSSYDKGLEALQSMNRVQQVELVHGFVEMKTELKDYLKKFAENGKVVREEDIAEFFAQLAAKKRQRTDTPLQYFCK